jgi:hypothetical protein
MSATVAETTRKRAVRGQLQRDTHDRFAPAQPFADPAGTGDGFDQLSGDTQTTCVEADLFADLDGIVADPVGDGFDRHVVDTLLTVVEAEPSAGDSGETGLPGDDTQCMVASLGISVREDGGIDPSASDIQECPVDPNLIAAIRSLHREHRGLQNAVTGMTLRIKSDERWAAAARTKREGATFDGKKFPAPTAQDVATIKATRPRYYDARAGIEALRKQCQKELLIAAKLLPAAAWVATIKGFGMPSFAAIVGEAGDLGEYGNPAKLWKRFSLHVIDGHASRRVKGDDSQGFVSRRRAEAHVIGDTLVRAGGAYADLYRTRKAYEIEKLAAAGIEVKPAARIRADQWDKFMSAGQVHKRALRYVEKRLLLDLWRAWRRTNDPLSPSIDMSSAD